ncbi:MAG TPA: tyrosine--tRNA ligase [Acidobacteriota bacterium]|nr:tyrosine--tRNA ligase [Acidobacteriota bacterium]
MTLEEQLDYLERGSVDLITRDDLKERLAEAKKEGRRLKVKVGFDPTAPDLHLGHTVILRKMRHFQDLGHDVVFLIGDFTGMIGDPSGRNKLRPPMSREELEANAETYKEQVFKILDPERTIVDFNSRWLGELGAEGFIKLAARYTVARMLERDDFENRYKSNVPIFMHEILYPLAQAYDSVALECDVEMGGTDQKFNLLVGRDIMREYDLKPQIVLTVPLLEGLDGLEKMSKSYGNYVGINEAPGEMFGKLMSISDEMMWRYYELLTDLAMDEIEGMRREAAMGEFNPMQAKIRLAKLIIGDYHGAAAAKEAEEAFSSTFSKRQVPDDIPETAIKAGVELWLIQLLSDNGLVASKGEGRRLVRQGAVSIDGDKVSDEELRLILKAGDELVIKVGKRRWLKVTAG